MQQQPHQQQPQQQAPQGGGPSFSLAEGDGEDEGDEVETT